ncbi:MULTISPECIES: DUF2793 domain-containing protein [unclassified Sphingobium]|uniref:DUF2793 domain-containing protein n=1 Tax=unclassified Sphingobium TaxID=2611147 RepID=UPI002225990C|nr:MULTISPECIES: DUF2793 domain-containing protein [unclassified Sphingobium]MCW2382535.1 hypothetical protein [Sphingobium sp. B2D3B]MCW2397292.1 hypothetical protein [Sphingobium sp. B2D3C]
MAQTDRFGLPLLSAGQAQKELTHNEALSLIDIAIGRVVESASLSAPPAAPDLGACWLVGSGATGEWAGCERMIAAWTAAGWRFLAPFEGLHCWKRDTQSGVRFQAGDWREDGLRTDGFYVDGEKVIGSRRPAIANPSGGAPVDSQAREAIISVLDTLRAHGLIAS